MAAHLVKETKTNYRYYSMLIYAHQHHGKNHAPVQKEIRSVLNSSWSMSLHWSLLLFLRTRNWKLSLKAISNPTPGKRTHFCIHHENILDLTPHPGWQSHPWIFVDSGNSRSFKMSSSWWWRASIPSLVGGWIQGLHQVSSDQLTPVLLGCFFGVIILSGYIGKYENKQR